jgi:nicotinamidase-related amidase
MAERSGGDVLLALHYQNENCHPDGKIKVGISEGAAWRAETLDRARRLLQVARANGVAIAHVRLAVRPDHRDVIQNNFIFKQWVELGAWAEGSWGVAFLDGCEPAADEFVVTHTRNNAFYGCQLEEVVRLLAPRRLYVAGVSTAYVVESTVRHAADVGYDVWVVGDCCSTATMERHQAALTAMALVAGVTDLAGFEAATSN